MIDASVTTETHNILHLTSDSSTSSHREIRTFALHQPPNTYEQEAGERNIHGRCLSGAVNYDITILCRQCARSRVSETETLEMFIRSRQFRKPI
jgi:hypothetical protein